MPASEDLWPPISISMYDPTTKALKWWTDPTLTPLKLFHIRAPDLGGAGVQQSPVMYSPSQAAAPNYHEVAVSGVVNICCIGLAPQASRLKTGPYITSVVSTACLTASLQGQRPAAPYGLIYITKYVHMYIPAINYMTEKDAAMHSKSGPPRSSMHA